MKIRIYDKECGCYFEGNLRWFIMRTLRGIWYIPGTGISKISYFLSNITCCFGKHHWVEDTSCGYGPAPIECSHCDKAY